jgi:spermidine synthase
MSRLIPLSIVWLGFSAVVVQIVMLRELLCLFSGNELVTGIVFGNWLLLTAAGSILARSSACLPRPFLWQSIILTILSLLAPLEMVFLRYCRQFMDTGLALGFDRVFFLSLLILLPYCLLSGFLLTFFATTFKKDESERANSVGWLYFLDTLGGALGGVIFGAFCIALLSPFQSLFVLSGITCLVAALIAGANLEPKACRIPMAFSAVVLAATLAAALLGNVEHKTLSWLMKGQQLIEYRHTPYGTLSIFKEGNQFNFFENGVPTASTNDVASAESTVHFAMAQHSAPRTVLLVAGGLTGAYQEIVKYPSVQNIDYVELDPAVVEVTEKYVGKNPRVHAIVQDARQYIGSRRSTYDVIVMSLPDPVNYQLNRYYTQEFFALVKRALSKDGVFGFQVAGAANYLTAQDRLLLSSVQKALSASFQHTLYIPGTRVGIVASSRELSFQIPELLASKGITTRYVNQNYLNSLLTEDRIKAVARATAQPGSANRDFHPVSVYAHLSRWTEEFGMGLLAPSSLVLLSIIFMLLPVLSQPRREVSFALSSTAFAGMGLQIVLIIAFQSYFGVLYQHIGIFIASFLIGGAAGTYVANRLRQKKLPGFLALDFLVLVSSVLCAGILSWPGAWQTALSFGFVLLPLLNAWTGFLVGAQFPFAVQILQQAPATTTSTAGALIALDLTGASAGAFLLSTLLIPSLGVVRVCYLLAGLKAASSLATCWRWRFPASPAAGAIPFSANREISFLVLVSVFVIEATLALGPQTGTGLYAISFLPGYQALLLILAAIGIVSAMDLAVVNKFCARHFAFVSSFSEKVFQVTRIALAQWLYFLLFSLLIFFPIFKCYFQIPYLFCHVCPRKCAFGFLRPYLIPAVLIMNLSARSWCFHYCPVGALQSCRTGSLHRTVKTILRIISLVILGLTAYSYFKIKTDVASAFKFNSDWYITLFKNNYDTSIWVLVIVAAILLVSFLLPRLFCHGICPVGTLSELFQIFERKTEKKVQSENE